MVQVNKIDSNVTGLRYAEEVSLKVLPGTPNWIPLEPNSYDDFGGDITTVARNPINESRQRQKGVVVDLDAAGGFNNDLTQSNFEDILQGFFFADLRPKGEEEPTGANSVGNIYEVAATAGFLANDIIEATGFADASNNGIKDVTAIVLDTSVAVSQTLVTEASPPAGAKIVVVGHTFAAGDLDVDASGVLPVLTTATKDLTELGLIPGEWIYVGGDNASEAFAAAANNGFMRVRTIATNSMTIDKADGTLSTEASTTETIKVYLGRVLKNESDPTLIKRRSYNLERTLGVPDDASPAQIHAEYLEGAVANEFTMNYNTADKITADLSFVATDHTTVDGPTALKTGNRPALVGEDGINTSNDFSRLKMNVVDETNENPTSLFGFLTEFTVAINNNVSPNKAISVLGAFDLTAGQFNVEGTATAYFSNVAAIAAIRNNSDVTMDFALVKNNSGVLVDIPLIALGGGRLDVAQDEPILMPLETPAAADRTFNHTLLMQWFDYLPNAADV
jgi:hypothetical protein